MGCTDDSTVSNLHSTQIIRLGIKGYVVIKVRGTADRRRLTRRRVNIDVRIIVLRVAVGIGRDRAAIDIRSSLKRASDVTIGVGGTAQGARDDRTAVVKDSRGYCPSENCIRVIKFDIAPRPNVIRRQIHCACVRQDGVLIKTPVRPAVIGIGCY